MTHDKRPALSGREPVHVTLRVLAHVYNLRTRRCFEVLFAALAASCHLDGFRVVGLTVQGHHLHLLVEAANAAALARGIQSLSVRIAKGLNRLMGRRGQVFERFHARPLRNPRQVRAALGYILRNTTKHAGQVGRRRGPDFRDPYTAGYFGPHVVLPAGTAALVVKPETWLLREGWKRRAAPVSAAGPTDATRQVPPQVTRSVPSRAARPPSRTPMRRRRIAPDQRTQLTLPGLLAA